MNTADTFVIPIDAALVSIVYDPDEWVLTDSETIEPWAAAVPICQGDMNEDGNVRGDDIEPFIAAHLDASLQPESWRRADMDFDKDRDADDMAIFVTALLAGNACPTAP